MLDRLKLAITELRLEGALPFFQEFVLHRQVGAHSLHLQERLTSKTVSYDTPKMSAWCACLKASRAEASNLAVQQERKQEQAKAGYTSETPSVARLARDPKRAILQQ